MKTKIKELECVIKENQQLYDRIISNMTLIEQIHNAIYIVATKNYIQGLEKALEIRLG